MFKKFLSSLIVLSLLFFVGVRSVSADELSDIEKQLNDLKHSLELSQQATKPLEKNLTSLKVRLNNIKRRVSVVENNINQKEREIKISQKVLVFQEKLLHERVRSYYKNLLRKPSTLLFLLVGDNVETFFHNFFYQQRVVDEDKNTIIKIVLYIKNLQERKDELEREKVELARIKERVSQQSSFLEGEISKAKKYQAELKSKIAQLTARQKQLIAQKLAGLHLPTTLGAGPLYCTDDRKIDPGFSPAFAFYTYGIPHRVGMNQYGAYGRAEAGQDYHQILNAYFSNISFQKHDDIEIEVEGAGKMHIEDYLLGIYEIPESWPLEALKAQAVAARSYAIAYTHDGKNPICTTQKCQVWKSEQKTGAWKQAVEETKGEVMTYNGQVITAWYASTAGGYTFSSSDVGWSSKPWTKHIIDANGSINNFNDLNQKAYDRSSPCFYAAQGWRKEYNNSAWLKPEEVADIANVILLARLDSSIRDHLYQLDKPNPAGTDNWDMTKVRSELQKRGKTPFRRISNVSVSADFSAGKTTSVTVTEGGHSENFNGSEFKNFFNLRAPANIQIVGPLYNVERR